MYMIHISILWHICDTYWYMICMLHSWRCCIHICSGGSFVDFLIWTNSLFCLGGIPCPTSKAFVLCLLLLLWTYEVTQVGHKQVYTTWWQLNQKKTSTFSIQLITIIFPHDPGQEFDYLEFFAGAANLSKCMASAGFNTRSFDVLYAEQQPTRKSNFMNLCHASGFGFLVKSIYILLFLDNPP